MKRGYRFECGHPGASTQYCSTFAEIQRVKLCPACVRAVNDNPEDPRYVAETVGGAIDGRDHKHDTRK